MTEITLEERMKEKNIDRTEIKFDLVFFFSLSVESTMILTWCLIFVVLKTHSSSKTMYLYLTGFLVYLILFPQQSEVA